MGSPTSPAHTSASATSDLRICAAGLDIPRTLFIGIGDSAVCWYRCALPAMFLSADWCGMVGTPPRVLYRTGYVRGGTKLPAWNTYDVVVIQQPYGQGWLRVIRELQQAGVKVVYEVDDYIHGIHKVKGHDWSQEYDRKQVAAMELCMRCCDAMIVSTDYLARRYRKFNRNIYVCRNGLDLGRYRVTRPEREMVHIGWAGATGHESVVVPWLQAVADTMSRHPRTAFVSIGQDFATPFMDAFGPHRALAVPFCLIDSYPAAMANIDIALAPAGSQPFHLAKSDLRWLEAAALGIPVIADPVVYPEIEPGVTGLHATTPAELEEHLDELVADATLRRELGEAARRHLVEERTMQVAAGAWREALRAVVD